MKLRSKILLMAVTIVASAIVFMALGYAIGHYADINNESKQYLFENDNLEEVEILGSSDKEIFKMLNVCREQLLNILFVPVSFDPEIIEDTDNCSTVILSLLDEAYLEQGVDYDKVVSAVKDTNSIINRFNFAVEQAAKERKSIVKLNINREKNHLAVHYIGIDKSQLKNYDKTCAILFGGFGVAVGIFACLFINAMISKKN